MKTNLFLVSFLAFSHFAQAQEVDFFTVDNFEKVPETANVVCTGNIDGKKKNYFEVFVDSNSGFVRVDNYRNKKLNTGHLGKIFTVSQHLSDPRGGHLRDHWTYIIFFGHPGSNSVNNDVLILDKGIDTNDNDKPVLVGKLVRDPASGITYDMFDTRLNCSKIGL